MQLKTEFETLEDAIAYLKTEAQAEVDRLESAEQDFKAAERRILANKDAVVEEKRALQGELDQAKQKLAAAEAKTAEDSDVEAKYRNLYEQDKQSFEDRLKAIEAEREAEKKAALEQRRNTAILEELSKPSHSIINPSHFLKLHGDRITLDTETGELYVDMGDYKRQPVTAYVQDIQQRPDEQHLFKPKGGKGNDSPGPGSSQGMPPENPFKTGNLTEQSRLFKSNPALYNRFKQEAGA